MDGKWSFMVAQDGEGWWRRGFIVMMDGEPWVAEVVWGSWSWRLVPGADGDPGGGYKNFPLLPGFRRGENPK